MKLILVARKALAAYLISSAVSRPVTTIGTSMRFNGRYSARNRASARSPSTPMTIRSGRMKSAIAAPSRRNSGFEATSKSASGLISATIRLTCRAVPTGTVDLSTTTLSSRRKGAIRRAASYTNDRSACPSPRRDGVPTAMKISSAPPTPRSKSVVNRSRPCPTLRATSSSSPGS